MKIVAVECLNVQISWREIEKLRSPFELDFNIRKVDVRDADYPIMHLRNLSNKAFTLIELESWVIHLCLEIR